MIRKEQLQKSFTTENCCEKVMKLLLVCSTSVIIFYEKVKLFLIVLSLSISNIIIMAKNHKKYRKDKPWDTEDIDHWKTDTWDPESDKSAIVQESSFATLFPKYREKYLREVWGIVTKALEVRNR